MKEYNRLLKNLIATGLIVLFIVLAVYYFARKESEHNKIDDTPIRIESVKKIAEISTISYKDEVVIDTVEFYSNDVSLTNPMDWPDIYTKAKNGNIKRRLTLIIHGEVKYGIDLTDNNYSIKSNQDTIWLTLPDSEILDIVLTPSKTEVFHEIGDWQDGSRKELEAIARERLRTNAESLQLKTKANENAAQLFRKLLHSNKTVIIRFG